MRGRRDVNSLAIARGGIFEPKYSSACKWLKTLTSILDKTYSGKTTCAECVLYLVVFLKPLADMVWSASWTDVVLTASAMVAFVLLVAERQIRFGIPDVVAFFLVLLVFRSWDGDASALSTMVKMASAFLLYYVGRTAVPYCKNVIKALRIASLICVAVCLLMYALGIGFKIWGSSRTFCGPYFFKTDLAFAMTFAAVLLLYWEDGPRWRFLAVAACAFLVFESNARAYYFIFIIALALYLAWRYSVRIGFKIVIGVALGIVALLELLNVVTSAGLLGNNFIGFQFNSLSDLFSGSNTQGRNEIWAVLIGMIETASSLDQLFGIDLTSDLILVNGSEYGSHSLYVGTLFNLGVVGLILLLAFIALVFRSVEVTQERKRGDSMPYITLTLLLTFLLSGISVHVLQYSANSWMPMLVFGMAVSLARESGQKRCGNASDWNVL